MKAKLLVKPPQNTSLNKLFYFIVISDHYIFLTHIRQTQDNLIYDYSLRAMRVVFHQ